MQNETEEMEDPRVPFGGPPAVVGPAGREVMAVEDLDRVARAFPAAAANASMALASTRAGGLAEVNAAAQAAEREARIKARYAVARINPRNWLDVWQRVMGECQRPGLAEEATWEIERGGDKITGPSIRLLEVLMRCAGNIEATAHVILDDEWTRSGEVTVSDLETNYSASLPYSFRKVVERKYLRKGQVPLTERFNSYGEKVYILRATDDEVSMMEAALVSKKTRVCAQRVMPGDLVADALWQAGKTIEKGVKAAPDQAVKRALFQAAALKIDAGELEDYLGCPVSKATPAELTALFKLFGGLREGAYQWRDVLQERRDSRRGSKPEDKPEAGATNGAAAAGGEASATEPAKAEPVKGAAGVRERVAARRGSKAEAKPETKPAATPAAETSEGPFIGEEEAEALLAELGIAFNLSPAAAQAKLPGFPARVSYATRDAVLAAITDPASS